MGFTDLGCYGGEINTPNLNRLAEHGLRFSQFYNTARCCPTRASLLTGLYPHQAGVGHMTEDKRLEGYRGELNHNCVTFGEVLRPAGYRTYAVGKWHVARNTKPNSEKYDWPLQRGFDRYFGTITGAGSYYDPATLTRDNTVITPFADPEFQGKPFYYTDVITDQALRFIRDHRHDHARQPFFMYVAYTAAHWPLHAKEQDILKYKGKYDGGYEPIRKSRLEKSRQLGLLQPGWELSPQWGNWGEVSNKAWESRCMEVYAAIIDCMDQGIGRIVAELQTLGQLDNTLIFFLQDNGGCAEAIGRTGHAQRPPHPTLPPISADALLEEMIPKQNRAGVPTLGGPDIMPGPEDTYISYGKAWANVSNTPFREYKHWVHEGGISTPLIVHWPQGLKPKPGGGITPVPGHLIDIMATCVEVAGATYPVVFKGEKIRPMEGVSLCPLFAGQELVRPNPLFWEHEGNRAVRMGRWKLVAKGPAGVWELYDMEKDRTEAHNLAAAQPERVRELVGIWEVWAKRAEVLPWIWQPPYGAKRTGSRQTHFEFKTGDDVSGAAAPDVGEHPFTLTAEVLRSGEGVILAHGGVVFGYAFLVYEGKLQFCTRNQNTLETVTATAPVPAGSFTASVSLYSQGRVTIKINGHIVGSGNMNGLLEQTPVEGLQVGRDGGQQVGLYRGGHPFKGQLGKVMLDLDQ